jgi:hypothetical protein
MPAPLASFPPFLPILSLSILPPCLSYPSTHHPLASVTPGRRSYFATLQMRKKRWTCGISEAQYFWGKTQQIPKGVPLHAYPFLLNRAEKPKKLNRGSGARSQSPIAWPDRRSTIKWGWSHKCSTTILPHCCSLKKPCQIANGVLPNSSSHHISDVIHHTPWVEKCDEPNMLLQGRWHIKNYIWQDDEFRC